MPRLNFVKSARKAQPEKGIEVGDSYYWWKFYRGGKMVSKTRPRASQLTQSAHKGAMYDLMDDLQALDVEAYTPDNAEDFEAVKDSIVDALDGVGETLQDLFDSAEESYENMASEGLEYTPVGEGLQERMDGTQAAIDSTEEAKGVINSISTEDHMIEVDEGEDDSADDEVLDIDSASQEISDALSMIDLDSPFDGF